MADFHSTGWVAGETVAARAVSATPPGASGATVASGTADTAGAVDFTGLATETNFRATGGTSGRNVNFRIGLPPQSAQSGSGAVLDTSAMLRLSAHQPVNAALTFGAAASSGALSGATSTITGVIENPDTPWKARVSAWGYTKQLINATDCWAPPPVRQGDGTRLTGKVDQNFCAIEFDWFTVAGKIGFGVYDLGQLRVMIDGQYASLATAGAAASNFAWQWVELSGASAGMHRVRLEVGGEWVAFGGIKRATADSIMAPTQGLSKRLSVIADSYGCGYMTPPSGTGSAPADLRGYISHLTRILGFTNFAGHASASTGFTLPTTNPSRIYLDRVPDVISAAPDYVLVQGSINDLPNVGTLQARATAVLTALKAGLPSAKIALSGVPYPTTATDYSTVNAALSAAAAAVGGVSFIDTSAWPVANTGLIYTTDLYHPSSAGHARIGFLYAQALAAAWNLPL